MATSVDTSGINFSDSTSQTTAVASADVQTFDSSGTWTKPSGLSMCKIMMWGGGGAGGRGTTGQGGTGYGGGGGAYNEVIMPLSYLGATVSINVGAGGTAISNTGVGGTGGASSLSFSSTWMGRNNITAYGGGGGGYSGGGSYNQPAGSSRGGGWCCGLVSSVMSQVSQENGCGTQSNPLPLFGYYCSVGCPSCYAGPTYAGFGNFFYHGGSALSGAAAYGQNQRSGQYWGSPGGGNSQTFYGGVTYPGNIAGVSYFFGTSGGDGGLRNGSGPSNSASGPGSGGGGAFAGTSGAGVSGRVIIMSW